MSEYLNPSELHVLTGYARSNSQAGWLGIGGQYQGDVFATAIRKGDSHAE